MEEALSAKLGVGGLRMNTTVETRPVDENEGGVVG